MRADLNTLHSLRDEHGTHGCCNSMPTHGHPAKMYTHARDSTEMQLFFENAFVASVTLIFKIYCLLLSITTENHTLRRKKCAFSTVFTLHEIVASRRKSFGKLLVVVKRGKIENFLEQSREYRDRAKRQIYLYVDFMSVCCIC